MDGMEWNEKRVYYTILTIAVQFALPLPNLDLPNLNIDLNYPTSMERTEQNSFLSLSLSLP